MSGAWGSLPITHTLSPTTSATRGPGCQGDTSDPQSLTPAQATALGPRSLSNSPHPGSSWGCPSDRLSVDKAALTVLHPVSHVAAS